MVGSSSIRMMMHDIVGTPNTVTCLLIDENWQTCFQYRCVRIKSAAEREVAESDFLNMGVI